VAHERLKQGIFVELHDPLQSVPRITILAKLILFRANLSVSRKEALLSESEDWSFGGRRAAFGNRAPASRQVSFDRRELNAILRIYGRKVAEGEWRDYAIDHLEDRAVFSIFRRASEMPMFRVEKIPALSRKQGAYRIVAATGMILRRGHELANVLRSFDRPRLALVPA
jgi:hypothetical protein